ncbi:short-chain dehydrogenase/reductase SDR [Caballeronia calidae]|uniref:Short-chain dehydrogenase/reductase SDR n=1 Tax=Caballeronia calidae TaxID=1777139 RepID=A0A158EFS0_9BURK|nr:glucose 1-dehydrogenase [Caballeronia calidae]SAL05643.1 short-chain dehydrogenase/reductase SDR [Caballeronia calidae]
MSKLSQKFAIVFGGGCSPDGTSNGAAAAIAYAREGAGVAVVDLNTSAAERTVELIREEGAQAVAITADVTSFEQIRNAVQLAISEFGTLDILHNNVGINVSGGPVDMDEEVWDKVLATNLKSIFLTSKAVLPTFVEKRSGAIVNVSSITGIAWHGRPTIAYSSSKAAVNQFTRALAAQYGPENIRCNALLVGSIDTPRASSQLNKVWDAKAESMLKQRIRSVPLRRLGSPWDVAKAAVFLASDDAAYITGAVVPVDGGITCSIPHAVSE